jgi:alkanesulfonate monooxygenase SsuD/methylene tetrahydromethanopterin reductase-like flavin-dependent oxidoreductase (luciferase family)
MKIGVFATFMSPLATPQMIADFGRRAESMGLDSIWMGEHVALFDKNTFGYPGSKDGRIPVPEGGGMLDVTATFGFLAAATKRVRLGTGVALVPQRNPLYTAKEVCTLDWLSNGRIDFGIGVGWNKSTHIDADRFDAGIRRGGRGSSVSAHRKPADRTSGSTSRRDRAIGKVSHLNSTFGRAAHIPIKAANVTGRNWRASTPTSNCRFIGLSRPWL